MKRNLKARLKSGEAVHGCWLNMGSAVSSEIVGSAGFDWVLIDLEHGVGSEPVLIHQLQSLRGTDTSAFVRVERLEVARVKKVLDLGANGVMFPQIQDADEARRAISYMHYPPVGQRGLAKMIRATDYGANFETYYNSVQDNLLGIIQIETINALDNVDAIAAIDGVDVLFLGPADLSLALGILGQWDHPAFIEAVKSIGRAAKKAGKAAGVLFFDIHQYNFYYKHGFRFLASGSDMNFVNLGARSLVAELDKRRSQIQ